MTRQKVIWVIESGDLLLCWRCRWCLVKMSKWKQYLNCMIMTRQKDQVRGSYPSSFYHLKVIVRNCNRIHISKRPKVWVWNSKFIVSIENKKKLMKHTTTQALRSSVTLLNCHNRSHSFLRGTLLSHNLVTLTWRVFSPGGLHKGEKVKV